ncbi:hypothetical protein PUN28_009550 [Cardiocondyla obscurior]|uniref:Uncharacterized protein n=1 Tax=Cardiocondyla obscurior TaxID=286306 RepID=A0AAW2FSP3_9HYME
MPFLNEERTTRKDEIRRKGNGTREEEETACRRSHVLAARSIGPVCSSGACGPTMPTSGEPTATHFTPAIIFRARFHAAASISPLRRGPQISTDIRWK